MAEPVSADVLRALAHPLRLRLLVALEDGGEQTATELAGALDVTEGEVHQHLAPLHDAGLVATGAAPDAVHAAGSGWRAIAGQMRALQDGRPPRDGRG
jgi:predicted ArsR family transcriptional regulator